MSVYKVPQDVEADDKLLGPFNFRQFIYLIIVAFAIFIAIVLFQVFPGLVIIPLPIIIFFGALALPLRKDQPMEAYLAAVLAFYIKPSKRTWQPDGVEHLIEIYAPKVEEDHRIKDIGQDEASRRLSYLADIVDTEGWAIKHSVAPSNNLNEVYATEAKNTNDIFENGQLADNIDSMLQNTADRRREEIMRNMNTARNLADFTNYNADQIQQQTFSQADLYNRSLKLAEQARSQNFPSAPAGQNQFNNTQFQAPATVQNPQPQQNYNNQSYQTPEENINLTYNPYPNSMHQTVISPLNSQPNMQPQQFPQQQIQPAFQSQSAPQPQEINPQIMRLVSEGSDLSIETIARQANKINNRNDEIDLNEDEIVISLR